MWQVCNLSRLDISLVTKHNYTMKPIAFLRHSHCAVNRALRCLMAGAAVCSFSGLNAQTADTLSRIPENVRMKSMINSTHIIGAGEEGVMRDSLERLLTTFYVDQFRHFQDPRAPYFMFMSKSSKIAMGVGGLVRIRGYYDWNGSIPINGFSPYSIPIPKDPTSMRRLAATPSGTGFFVTLLGNHTLLGDYMAFIQVDFSGYNGKDLKLKKAYMQAGDWTAGYATTTFEDTKAEPSTIDGAGPNGINSRTNVLVRYMHTFKGKWTVAGSVEFPSSSIAADGEYTKACSDYVPDMAAFAQYQWAGGASHVRLSGLARVLTYRDMLQARNHNIFGWGLQLSTVIKALPQFNLYGIASVGHGHESYTTDLASDKLILWQTRGRKGDCMRLWLWDMCLALNIILRRRYLPTWLCQSKDIILRTTPGILNINTGFMVRSIFTGT